MDAGQAGLVVVGVSDMGAKIEAAMKAAKKVETKELKADNTAIEADAKDAGAKGRRHLETWTRPHARSWAGDRARRDGWQPAGR